MVKVRDVLEGVTLMVYDKSFSYKVEPINDWKDDNKRGNYGVQWKRKVKSRNEYLAIVDNYIRVDNEPMKQIDNNFPVLVIYQDNKGYERMSYRCKNDFEARKIVESFMRSEING